MMPAFRHFPSHVYWKLFTSNYIALTAPWLMVLTSIQWLWRCSHCETNTHTHSAMYKHIQICMYMCIFVRKNLVVILPVCGRCYYSHWKYFACRNVNRTTEFFLWYSTAEKGIRGRKRVINVYSQSTQFDKIYTVHRKL